MRRQRRCWARAASLVLDTHNLTGAGYLPPDQCGCSAHRSRSIAIQGHGDGATECCPATRWMWDLPGRCSNNMSSVTERLCYHSCGCGGSPGA